MALRLFLLWNYLGTVFLLYALVQFWKEGRRSHGHVTYTGHGNPTSPGGAKIIVIPHYDFKDAARGKSGTPSGTKKCE